MDTLNLTKRDIVCVLAACALIPVVCFIAGFLIAGKGHATVAAAPFAPVLTVTPASENEEAVSEHASNAGYQPLPLAVEVASGEAGALANTLAEPETPAIEPAGPGEQYLVQAGLFSSAQNAERYVGTLAGKGISAQVLDTQREGTRYYRVVIGTFAEEAQATAYLMDVERLHDIDLYLARVEMTPEYLASL